MSADPMRDLRRVVRSVAIAVALLAAAGGPTGVHHSPDIPTSIRPHQRHGISHRDPLDAGHVQPHTDQPLREPARPGCHVGAG